MKANFLTDPNHQYGLKPHMHRYFAFFALSISITFLGITFRQVCHHANHQFVSFLIQTASKASHLAIQPWYLNRPYLPLIIVPLSFAMICYLANHYFLGIDRGGIPQSKYALTTKNLAIRNRILSLRAVAGKFVLTAASFLCGASVGLEGPIIFMSTAMTYALSRSRIPIFKEHLNQSLVIMTGGVIGIAVAFNAPLSGISFVIEEHHRAFGTKLSRILIPPIIMSTIIIDLFIKRTQYFSATSHYSFSLKDWFIVPFVAVVGGLLGGLFSRLLFHCIHYLSHLKQARQKIFFAALCGLLVAIVGLISNGNSYGAGFFEADKLIVGQGYLAMSFTWFKMLSTFLSYISGIPGGILSPSLTIGASLGNLMSLLFPESGHNLVIILSMLAYFTGVLQTPMTCLLIVLEMTGRHDLVVPMMATAWFAKITSSVIFKTPLYQALSSLCHLRYGITAKYK